MNKDTAFTVVDLVGQLPLGYLSPEDEKRAQALHRILVQHHVQIVGVNRTTLLDRVIELLDDDPAFRRSVTAQLATTGTTISAGGSITASGNGVIAGRDVDQSRHTQHKKTNYGGILVAGVAVVALFLVGKTVINNLGTDEPSTPGTSSVLTGNHTCRDFLAADQPTQLATLKRIYLDAGDAERAGDPFIMQNGQYTCGQAPNMKLSGLARR
ncbi:hypothetical protein JNUCC0626_26790 [Lentzea sp. JNUCC 0626]|uniref:hypothetical protein n=1 Tax=Lentzea sp. JNUCC 0626 TaxID=3367513 RepID=UPI003748F0EC